LGADRSELEELGVENIDENHIQNLMWTYWKLDEKFGGGGGGDGHIGNTKI
jgi:hypothetical protein